ncbi:MAG: nuclear transport factor 2 family protein [Devosia sp.]|jgi:ketosteroid isomerase-like protein
MGLSHAEMDAVVDDHFRFEATDDIDGVLASFADGALTHEIIPSPVGILHERPQIADYYRMLFGSSKGEKVTNIRRLYGDDFLVDETLWEGEQMDGKPFLLAGKGGHMSVRILHIFTFRDGRISSEQAWLDLAAIQRQLS